MTTARKSAAIAATKAVLLLFAVLAFGVLMIALFITVWVLMDRLHDVNPAMAFTLSGIGVIVVVWVMFYIVYRDDYKPYD